MLKLFILAFAVVLHGSLIPSSVLAEPPEAQQASRLAHPAAEDVSALSSKASKKKKKKKKKVKFNVSARVLGFGSVGTAAKGSSKKSRTAADSHRRPSARRVDYSGLIAVLSGGLTASGYASSSPTPLITNIFTGFGDRLFVSFKGLVSLTTGRDASSGGCLLGEVSLTTGLVTCLDSTNIAITTNSLNYPFYPYGSLRGMKRNSSAGTLTYKATSSSGALSVVQVDISSGSATTLATGLTEQDYFESLNDGSIVTSDRSSTLRRHYSTSSSESIGSSGVVRTIYKLPNGQLLMWGNFVGIDANQYEGGQLYSPDTKLVDSRPWIVSDSSGALNAYNNIYPSYCSGAPWSGSPLCSATGIGQIYETDAGAVYATLGASAAFGNEFKVYGSLARIYPDVQPIALSLTSITSMIGRDDRLYLFGALPGGGYGFVEYNLSTESETILQSGGYERVYSLGVAGRQLFFNGFESGQSSNPLMLGTGSIDLDTREVSFEVTQAFWSAAEFASLSD